MLRIDQIEHTCVATSLDAGRWTSGSGSCHGGETDPFSFEEVHTVEQTQHETFAHQECPDCHALAADLEAHKQWHSRLVHDIATAVDRDVTRRVGAQ